MENADGYAVVAPKEFIVPQLSGSATAQPTISGALFMSGSKLYFAYGGVPVLVTSA